jgi:hypothetical protein
MSLATLANPRAYCVVEYTAIDETTCQFHTMRFRVSPEVAAVLAEREAPLRELTFTDLKGEKRPGEADNDDERRGEIDPETVLRGVARRIEKRKLRDRGGSPWEGPRPNVVRIIGATHIWNGPPRRFQFCGGRRLRPGEVCLDCDRMAREMAVGLGEEPLNQPARSRSGKRLAGGVGR